MLSVRSRADYHEYRDVLAPPRGYELDFAFCVTYSLDLDALLGAYLALGLSVDTDSAIRSNQLQLFGALRKVREKVLVFCERGRVRARRPSQPLYALIDESVIEVDLQGERDDDPSFHPKLWVLRFANGHGVVRYRVVVLSRNLTFDDSWDIAGVFEGRRNDSGGTVDFGGDFRDSLKRLLLETDDSVGLSDAQIRRLNEVIDELGRTSLRFEDEDGWQIASSSRLHTSGCPREVRVPFLCVGPWKGKGNDFARAFEHLLPMARRVLIVSPFLSKEAGRREPFSSLEEAGLSPERCRLVVRREALLDQPADDEWFERIPVYAIREDLRLSDTLDDDPVPVEDPGTPERLDADGDSEAFARLHVRDLHAKLYAIETGSEGALRTHLLFGSANATTRGFTTNAEVMAHVCSDSPDAFDGLLRELGLDDASQEEGGLFERIDIEELRALAKVRDVDEGAELDRDFRRFLRRLRVTLEVEPSEGDSWRPTVRLDTRRMGPELVEEVRDGALEVALMTGGEYRRAELAVESAAVELPVVPLDRLTEFIRLKWTPSRGEPLDGIVKCEVAGQCVEVFGRRRAAIFRRLCGADRRQFIDYMTFLLSPNPEHFANAMRPGAQGGGPAELSRPVQGLFDNLLRSYRDRGDETGAIVVECVRYLESGEVDAEVEDVLAMLEAFRVGASAVPEAGVEDGR